MLSVERYEIGSLIGRGGMAEVYRGVDRAETPPRPIAIKRMLEILGDDPSFARLFEDEARITSRLKHPNIIAVLDSGILEGRPFQVLELVEGPDCSALLRRRRFPTSLALFVAREVASALAHAHAATDEQGAPLRIVHRDVTPSNIMIDLTGRVKLGDFGIALGADRRERTSTGHTKGKAAYMSPEQLLGARVDGRADVFALGCSLHALLTGRSPLADPNAVAGLLAGEPLPLSSALDPIAAAIIRGATFPQAIGRSTIDVFEQSCRAALTESDEVLRERLVRFVRGEEIGDHEARITGEMTADIEHPLMGAALGVHEPTADVAAEARDRPAPSPAVPAVSRPRWLVAAVASAVVAAAGLFALMAARSGTSASDERSTHLPAAPPASPVRAQPPRAALEREPPQLDASVVAEPAPEIGPALAVREDEAPTGRAHTRAPRRASESTSSAESAPTLAATPVSGSSQPVEPVLAVLNLRLPRDASILVDGAALRDASRGHVCDPIGLCRLRPGRYRLSVSTSSGEAGAATLCMRDGQTARVSWPLPDRIGCD